MKALPSDGQDPTNDPCATVTSLKILPHDLDYVASRFRKLICEFPRLVACSFSPKDCFLVRPTTAGLCEAVPFVNCKVPRLSSDLSSC